MGLWNWIETKYTGVDLEQVQKDSDAADAQNMAINQQKLADGSYSQEDYDKAQSDIVTGQINAQSEVNTAFVEGAKEGLANEQKLVKGTINGVTGGILGFIPWWFYPVGIIVLFFYFGGGTILKSAITRKYAK